MLVVTSSVPGEGKSVTAANLACVLAEDPDKKVILIDADMRKPTAHRLFGVDNHRGLSDYLSGGSMLEMALQRSRLPNLWVLPAGHSPANPTELLSGKRMEDLVARLRRDYNWVVVDTPPVIATTDAAVLSPRVDGTVLVVRMERTQRDVSKHAVELLRKSRANVVGTVLTGLQGAVQDYYYYPSYGREAAK
ncbi:MAG: putative tyrosine-protein kinase YveL [Planctomycetes bacterium]|nr:putative tyrosine-protein kinase YveL [Planctomycetota bacterium]